MACVVLGLIAVKIEEANKPKVILNVGDRVRMIDGKSVGIIDKIEKKYSPFYDILSKRYFPTKWCSLFFSL